MELAPTEEVDGERAGGAYYFVSYFWDFALKENKLTFLWEL